MKSRHGSLVLTGLVITVFLGHFSPAIAKVRKSTLGGNNGKSAIALDPQQQPHVSYQSADYRLHHAWLSGRKWQNEVVDDTGDCGSWNSIAVDNLGRVHISYHSERMNPYRQVLSHAVFDGVQWQITDVGDGGYSTSIALGTNGHAQILHYGNSGITLKFSKFDGNAWDTQDTGLGGGLWFFPTALALDSDDTAHITYTARGGEDSANYARQDSGMWESEILDSQVGGNLATSLALDSLGRPHVAEAFQQTIRLRWFDGLQWLSEDIFDEPDVPQYPDAVALAFDEHDRPHILFSTFFSVGGGGVNVTVYTYFDGVDWRGILVDKKNAGFNVAVAVDGNRVVHGLYRLGRGNRSTLKYAQITLPDVTGHWDLTDLIDGPESLRVDATLTVRNQGTDKSKSVPVAFYLSEDAVLDDGDTLLPLIRKTGGLKPDAEKVLSLEFQLQETALGKYLIAVIDPDKILDDLDRPNNTIAIQLLPPIP